jgi:L-threonylcarbamoyladenylate synthase
VKKLFAIKNRPDTQPVSALFSSVDDAKKYVMWNERAEELAQQYLPGPLTLILPMRNDAPTKLFPNTLLLTPHSSLLTVGIRISSHPDAIALVSTFGSPLSTTSANLHGQPNPYSPKDILEQFAQQKYQPDLILDSGMLPIMPPSTVIDLANENKIHRQGSIRP